MKQEFLLFGEQKIFVLLPDEILSPLPVYYFLDMDDGMLASLYQKWEKRYQKKRIIAVNVPVHNWNDDLSPWEMEPVFFGQKSFGGKADLFLDHLLTQICPMVEERFPVLQGQNALVGYSLAGLFALYSAYKTNRFQKIGCLSGSLWFRDLLPFTQSHSLLREDMKFYFSLGDKESKVKNPAIASIGEMTALISENLAVILGENAVRYETTSGGHSSQVETRFDKAFSWLIKG